MARRSKQSDSDDLLMEDELAAAFLEDDEVPMANNVPVGHPQQQQPQPMATHGHVQPQQHQVEEQDWDEDEAAVPGQLAVDVYESKEKLFVKARTAGVNKDDLDVSISDNVLTVRGTLSSGDEVEAENYHIQECYWGEFSRSVTLPVSVKEDEVEAVLKDGVLTIAFNKVKQDTVKKIKVI